MFANQYQHEYQYKVILDTYHHEAIQDEQRRLARVGRPCRINTIMGLLVSAFAESKGKSKGTVRVTCVRHAPT